ncbi:MAG: HIT domain-containing protein [Clostridiales bacterium]|nr:HIT domain-containing protein [Clostridiales bacterium]
MIKQSIILNDEEDKHFENETMIAVRSNNLKNNTLIGSYVIIPKSQVGSPFELSSKEWEDSKALMLELKKYIDEKYKPDGYNIGWNVGKAAGQEVAHAHMHIIPRYNDEPLAGKGLRYWFKQPENVRASLKNNED